MTDRWRTSLHGGHSGEFCDHAEGSLREVVNAAIVAGFDTYGISEHAPRFADELLYDEERAMGWTVSTLVELFDRYTEALFEIADEVNDSITLLRGFEAEVVPADSWLDEMRSLRARGFDYVVGSVHHVAETIIDGPPASFELAMRRVGGLEALTIEYYRSVTAMVTEFEPDVVGHFDLVRKNGHRFGDLDSPAAREAATGALHAIAASGAILDLNCAGFSKGLPTPYPAPHFVEEATALGIPFCLGDDSHGPTQVGRDLDRGRDYLLGLGVTTVTVLEREKDGSIRKARVPLSATEQKEAER